MSRHICLVNVSSPAFAAEISDDYRNKHLSTNALPATSSTSEIFPARNRPYRYVESICCLEDALDLLDCRWSNGTTGSVVVSQRNRVVVLFLALRPTECGGKGVFGN